MASAGEVVRLHAIGAAHAERARVWWQHERARVSELATAHDRREALAELRAERDRRRTAGDHFDTESAIVAYYLTAELDARGWRQRSWRPIPHDAGRLPGRRWGSAATGESARLRVHLPDELGELLRRATWWTSRPATRKLQALADTGHVGTATRDQLAAEITTTGDLLRSALHAAVITEDVA